jgi:uncharacterized protein YbjQ (UPF0145 family)
VSHPFLPDRPVDEQQSLASLEGGGLPLRAQRRLYELTHSQRPIFTSTLSPSEGLIAHAAGLEPITQVMGSSVYHVGWRGYASGWTGGELGPLTAAYDHARQLALSRMYQEAAMLHAHLVIGCTLVQRGHAWGGETLEFTASGTAVRWKNAPPAEAPALTLMQADEVLKLHHAGYWPVGIALGNCFWYENHADCMSEGNFWSSELPTHTNAAQSARHYATQRFDASSQKLGADGVVGVRVGRFSREFEYDVNDRSHVQLIMEVHLLGTAVKRRGDAGPPPRPKLVINLENRTG